MNLPTLLQENDPVAIARRLIGLQIVSEVDGERVVLTITETEAYWAPQDQASHARNGKWTPRTAVFYQPAGTAYVYLCYGIHRLLNVITGSATEPHAVLLRAGAPVEGLPTMLRRRSMTTLRPQLSAGPGVLSQALGVSLAHNGCDLLDPQAPIRLGVTEPYPPASELIMATPRIGIAYAGAPWTSRPWRFYLLHTPFVSQLNAFR